MEHECKKEQIIEHINNIILGNGKPGVLTRIELMEYRMSKFETEIIKIKVCLYTMISGIAYLILEPLISKFLG